MGDAKTLSLGSSSRATVIIIPALWGISLPRRGRKIGSAMRSAGHSYMPYPHPASESVTRVMRANRRRDTKPERDLRSMLHRRGFRFRKDYPIRIPGRTVRGDIVFPKKGVVVFVDGCYWHRCPNHGTLPRRNVAYWLPKLARNVERDRTVDLGLSAEGWHVVRIWEHISTADAANWVENALGVG